MNHSIIFSNFIDLINGMDVDPIPPKFWLRHRAEYELILCRICRACDRGAEISLSDFMKCSNLGSQPTISKRLEELESFNLICSERATDARVRLFKLAPAGESYLQRYAEIFLELFQASQVPNQNQSA